MAWRAHDAVDSVCGRHLHPERRCLPWYLSRQKRLTTKVQPLTCFRRSFCKFSMPAGLVQRQSRERVLRLPGKQRQRIQLVDMQLRSGLLRHGHRLQSLLHRYAPRGAHSARQASSDCEWTRRLAGLVQRAGPISTVPRERRAARPARRAAPARAPRLHASARPATPARALPAHSSALVRFARGPRHQSYTGRRPDPAFSIKIRVCRTSLHGRLVQLERGVLPAYVSSGHNRSLESTLPKTHSRTVNAARIECSLPSRLVQHGAGEHLHPVPRQQRQWSERQHVLLHRRLRWLWLRHLARVQRCAHAPFHRRRFISADGRPTHGRVRRGPACEPVCPANTYSVAGAVNCTACPTGSLSGSGASSCTCTSGYASSGSGTTLTCSGGFAVLRSQIWLV